MSFRHITWKKNKSSFPASSPRSFVGDPFAETRFLLREYRNDEVVKLAFLKWRKVMSNQVKDMLNADQAGAFICLTYIHIGDTAVERLSA